MGINYVPIINRINYLSENILCLGNEKIEKPENKKKIKYQRWLKRIKRISSNAID